MRGRRGWALLVVLAIVGWAGTAYAVGGGLVKTRDVPNMEAATNDQYERGIAYGDDHLWISADDFGTHVQLFKVTPAGAVVASWELGLMYGQHVSDVEYVDGTLWFVTNYGYLCSFDPATATVEVELTFDFWPKGLTWDGEYWWMAAGILGSDNTLIKVDPVTGDIVADFEVMSTYQGTNPMGMTWDGEYLYVAIRETEEEGGIVVRILNPVTGSVVQSFKAGVQIAATGLAFDGSYLWTVSPWQDKLYKIHALDSDGDGIGDAVDCAPDDPDTHDGLPEVCDGEDNNCDGLTDSDDPGLVVPEMLCEKQNGSCFGAKKTAAHCVWGAWQECSAADYAAFDHTYQESDTSCDGIDNNCDAMVDNNVLFTGLDGTVIEGIGKPCGAGICKGGFIDCLADKSGAYCTSEELAYDEICDGIDNDCDGVADGFGVVLLDGTVIQKSGDPCGTGVCAGGTAECTENGDTIFCPTEALATLEVCDGIDNDCDGKVDSADPVDLVANDPVLCENQTGLCAGSIKPANLCQNGNWVACDTAAYVTNKPAYEASTEVSCDAIDNDCDGSVDEDFTRLLLNGATVTGINKSCGTGSCAGGTTACLADKSGIYCTTEANASPEVCDAVDNDCDGAADAADPSDLLANDLTSCENQNSVCSGSTKLASRCVGGNWEACDDVEYAGYTANYQSGTETKCDGLDNDCSGVVDEDFSKTLLNGSVVSGINKGCGVGNCSGGTSKCLADQSGIYCPTEANAAAEICDAADNDCDGKTDAADAVDLVASDLTLCENQTGVCMGSSKPAYLCQGGSWSACTSTQYGNHSGHFQNGTELSCDAYDNDCDGTVDDDFTVTLLNGASAKGINKACGVGQCAGGLTVCNAAKSGIKCSTEYKASNEKCDAVDNDCDGKTDAADPTDLIAHDKTLCENQNGVCSGSWKPASRCTNGTWDACNNTEYSNYSSYFQSSVETKCDGKDNDCSGVVDEDFSMTQLNGQTVNGANNPCGAGACAGGNSACNASKNGIYCPGEGNASGEKCDNIDNDCDGKLDAGDPADLLVHDKKVCEKQSGVCAGSTKPTSLCVNGSWQSCPTSVYTANNSLYQAGSESSCDGSDNDCDGTADDDFSISQANGTTVTGVGKTCGVGACAGGTTKCTAAKTGIYCPTAANATNEKCDNVDNDCDGKTDAADPTDLIAHDKKNCGNQKGVCSGSSKPASLCSGGSWGACTNTHYSNHSSSFQSGSESSCDGLDNDCDGSYDEDFTMTLKNGTLVGFNMPCGVGVCAGGITACNGAKNGIYCPTESNATGEKCNKKDDDCDGKVDANDASDLLAHDKQNCETQTGSCSGVTKPASKCVNGSWQNCAYDNDGDGKAAVASCGTNAIDHCDNDSAHYLSNSTDNDGDGHAPKTACSGSKKTDDCDDSCGTCYPGSSQYTCNGDSKDQDCDGSVDEWDMSGWKNTSGTGNTKESPLAWAERTGQFAGCPTCRGIRAETTCQWVKNYWGSGMWQSCYSSHDNCKGSCDKEKSGSTWRNSGFGFYNKNQCWMGMWVAHGKWSGFKPVDGGWNNHLCFCQSWWWGCYWCNWGCGSSCTGRTQTRGVYRR